MQGKEKRNRMQGLIIKAWHPPCPSVRRIRSLTASCMMTLFIKLCRYRSWTDSDRDHGMVPQGCFAVYVGPARCRFVIKTKSVNHPLFRILLEEAENEYGFDFVGPLTLPCEVAVFRKIMNTLNTDSGDEDSVSEEENRLGLLSGRLN